MLNPFDIVDVYDPAQVALACELIEDKKPLTDRERKSLMLYISLSDWAKANGVSENCIAENIKSRMGNKELTGNEIVLEIVHFLWRLYVDRQKGDSRPDDSVPNLATSQPIRAAASDSATKVEMDRSECTDMALF